MDITATMVKELRDRTGAGMMDAKKALVEVDGDMDKAMEVLRQKGIASADKKMGRIAAEGRVGSYVSDSVGAMIEVNCETDFVAKNAEFIELTKKYKNCKMFPVHTTDQTQEFAEENGLNALHDEDLIEL